MKRSAEILDSKTQDSKTPLADAVRPMRPRELEDSLNYHLYHPLAWQVARRLASTPITPNMVSVFGGLCVVLAAIVYVQPFWLHLFWPWSVLLGLFLHMSWHVFDGADGDLARLTGQSSPMGELIDGICDYVSHIVLYLILGWLLAGMIGGAGWWLMLGAGISHIAQANHVEVQRRSYQWWVYGVPWLRNSHGAADSATRKGFFGGIVSGYLALASGMTPYSAQIDSLVQDAANSPDQKARIKMAVQTDAVPLLAVLKVLGPNPRALVLGLSMLFGTPLWYFLYLIVVLNLVLVWSVIAHNAAAKRIAAKLA